MHPLRMTTLAHATTLAAVSAETRYPADSCDGFGPLRQTSLARSPVLTATTQGQTLTDSVSTRGAAVHSMWPNGSSEADPPDGSNSGTPEWAARVNAGAGALAGNWVRELSGTVGVTSVKLGDTVAGTDTHGGGTGATTLSLKVRCVPGDSFSMEAQVKFTSAATTNQGFGGVFIDYFDSSENFISGNSNSQPASNVLTGLWLPVAVSATAPAGATSVLFRLMGSSSGGSAGTTTARFDAISVYKKTEAASSAASIAPALTLAAGGNTFTDIPGTSQSFTPITATRQIKVTLCFSASSNGVFTTSPALQVRIVFGPTTPAGSTYNFAYTTAQHLSWTFMWALPAATLGPVGTAVTVKAQVKSPTTSGTSLVLNGDDSVAMVIEEIG